MFDKEQTQFINVGDLQTIYKSLNRDPQEAIDLLEELNIDPEGLMGFEQFLQIMKQLENRLVAAKPAEIDGAGMQAFPENFGGMGPDAMNQSRESN